MWLGQFSKFLVVGGVCTLVNYAVFYLLYHYGSAPYLIASGVGFVAGTILGYGINKKWTFSAQESPRGAFWRYCGVYLASLILGLLFLKLLVSGVHLWVELANVLTIGLTTCTNFLGARLLVFKRRRLP